MTITDNNQEPTFTCQEILPNVFYFAFKNQKELNMTLCRVQEFYEAPNQALKGKYFDWPTFLDVYTNEKGFFNYFELWQGFNVPGNNVLDFISKFNDLSPREMPFFEEIKKAIGHLNGEKFYLIATKKGAEDTIAHEEAHALYYVNTEYKAVMDSITDTLPASFFKKMRDRLIELGYDDFVVKDEIQAYLSTSTPSYLEKRFYTDGSEVIEQMTKMQNVFKEYLESSNTPKKKIKF